MEREAADARYDELHADEPFHDGTFTDWSAKRTDSHPYHYRAGVSIWVAPVDVNPDDKFLTPPSPMPDDDEPDGSGE